MKKRIDWIDIVRAMGMFLIIMGHTLEGYTYSIVGKLIRSEERRVGKECRL